MTKPTANADFLSLLERARAAGPADRISLRDPIAAHGDRAIGTMVEWLHDERLAAFAVRVLEAIARSAGDGAEERAAVCDALWAVDRDTVPEPLARDIGQALANLGASKPRAPRRRATGASAPARSRAAKPPAAGAAKPPAAGHAAPGPDAAG
jgi:hypothetical protein